MSIFAANGIVSFSFANLIPRTVRRHLRAFLAAFPYINVPR